MNFGIFCINLKQTAHESWGRSYILSGPQFFKIFIWYYLVQLIGHPILRILNWSNNSWKFEFKVSKLVIGSGSLTLVWMMVSWMVVMVSHNIIVRLWGCCVVVQIWGCRRCKSLICTTTLLHSLKTSTTITTNSEFSQEI